MKNRGFTLIETLVVIIVIAFLTIIARPFFNFIMENVKTNAAIAMESEIKKAAESYIYVEDNFISGLNIGETKELSSLTLIDKGYIKGFKSPYSNNDCTGKVNVRRTEDEEFEFYPFINCDNKYETSRDTVASQENLVNSISHVYNSGPNNYTITINLRDSKYTRNDPISLITPTSTHTIYNPSEIAYSSWVAGTNGNSTGYSNSSGVATESERIITTNPWGANDITWSTLTNDATTAHDGGWQTSNFLINKDKKYRFSMWIKRDNLGTGSGRIYFGMYGYDSASANIGVKVVSTGATTTNPYFGSGRTVEWPLMINNWFLFVAYVHPSSYALTTSDPTSGIYDLSGNKIYSLSDYIWQTNSYYANHRTYLYDSTKIDEITHRYRPRVDLVDGSEPTLDDLLKGKENPVINGASNLITNKTLSYTVPTLGTYNFELRRIDGSSYNFSYTVK